MAPDLTILRGQREDPEQAAESATNISLEDHNKD